jgi:hypothetical protein
VARLKKRPQGQIAWEEKAYKSNIKYSQVEVIMARLKMLPHWDRLRGRGEKAKIWPTSLPGGSRSRPISLSVAGFLLVNEGKKNLRA